MFRKCVAMALLVLTYAFWVFVIAVLLYNFYVYVIEALKGTDNSSYNEGYEAGMAHVWNLLKNKYL